jgi:hypothetical protein
MAHDVNLMAEACEFARPGVCPEISFEPPVITDEENA